MKRVKEYLSKYKIKLNAMTVNHITPVKKTEVFKMFKKDTKKTLKQLPIKAV